MDLQNITGSASSKEVCKHSKYSNKLQWGNTKGLRGLDIRKQSEVEQSLPLESLYTYILIQISKSTDHVSEYCYNAQKISLDRLQISGHKCSDQISICQPRPEKSLCNQNSDVSSPIPSTQNVTEEISRQYRESEHSPGKNWVIKSRLFKPAPKRTKNMNWLQT